MLDEIDHWIFDLDNTLYHPSVRLFDQIEAKMEGYIIRELGVDPEEAKSLRADFWRNHGTTLAGLMQVYDIDPEPFLQEVHDIDHSALQPDSELAALISRLPGQRIIYTNGSRSHGNMVSTARGLRSCFHEIYGIEHAGYIPKPDRSAFDKIVKLAEIDPKRAIMFEDDPRNLLAPHQMGMRTVLVGPPETEGHIHHQTEDLGSFLDTITSAKSSH